MCRDLKYTAASVIMGLCILGITATIVTMVIEGIIDGNTAKTVYTSCIFYDDLRYHAGDCMYGKCCKTVSMCEYDDCYRPWLLGKSVTNGDACIETLGMTSMINYDNYSAWFAGKTFRCRIDGGIHGDVHLIDDDDRVDTYSVLENMNELVDKYLLMGSSLILCVVLAVYSCVYVNRRDEEEARRVRRALDKMIYVDKK